MNSRLYMASEFVNQKMMLRNSLKPTLGDKEYKLAGRAIEGKLKACNIHLKALEGQVARTVEHQCLKR